MNMYISNEAAAYMKEDLQAESGESVRFFVRYGGCGNIQTGFSLGVAKEDPVEPATFIESAGVRFYVEEQDNWYFDGLPFYIEWSRSSQEITFRHGETV
ncbi:HesB/YadR/YfhF family protein [Alkalicoccus luteus]|uniref:HesB/YadR/YfhF family protein n=1 Tax=Alkalicoccus luteus TaxID=1237094 RepID=UPI004034B8AA